MIRLPFFWHGDRCSAWRSVSLKAMARADLGPFWISFHLEAGPLDWCSSQCRLRDMTLRTPCSGHSMHVYVLVLASLL